MDLTVVDTLSMWTPAGVYDIQLLYGDITKLRKEDAVDIIMVSAFPGDYSPLRGTVIGALKHNLGLDVRDMSRAMELDLRTRFCCWLSRPMEEYQSYRRLLCFERQRGEISTVEEIRQMFRVFVPIFNNKESTVITPLLATGHQNKRKDNVLSTMVQCAAQWIMAGLSLKSFKIVIYGKENPELDKVFADLKTKFTQLSQKMEKKSQTKQIFDIFIVYQIEDKSWSNKVENYLKKKKSDVKICSDVQKFDNEKVWQDKIFQKMSCSIKILAILTPLFVSSAECLEQFNMAMCCNRQRKGNVLQPFYILTIESMPVYMNLVQYQDCRVRKEQDNVEIKIQDACALIVEKLADPVEGSDGLQKSPLDTGVPVKAKDYDVFVSYSHKNPSEADALLKALSEANPDLKIFFDRSELTMGSIWQKTLYDSMDTTRCVIALVSQTYVTSLVCQEEFNIALLRHLMDPSKMLFVPVCIEDLSPAPQGFQHLDMVDGRGDNFSTTLDTITNIVVRWIKTGEKTYFNAVEEELKDVNHEEIFELSRSIFVAKNYKLDVKNFTIYRTNPLPVVKGQDQEKSDSVDVAIGFAGDNMYCAMVLNNILSDLSPGLNVKFLWERNKTLLQDIDMARVIVLFVSRDFAVSDVHMQNLHLALCRQRPLKRRRVVHFVQTTDFPGDYSFLSLLPMAANFKDKIWLEFVKRRGKHAAEQMRKVVVSTVEDMGGSFSASYAEYLAMVKVGDDVLEELLNKDEESDSDKAKPMLLNVLQVRHEQSDSPGDSADIRLVKADELQEKTRDGHPSPVTQDQMVLPKSESEAANPGSQDKAPPAETSVQPEEMDASSTKTSAKSQHVDESLPKTSADPQEINKSDTKTLKPENTDESASKPSPAPENTEKSSTETSAPVQKVEPNVEKITTVQTDKSAPAQSAPVQNDESTPENSGKSDTLSDTKSPSRAPPEKSSSAKTEDSKSKSCEIL